MYRAVALGVVERGIDPADHAAVGALVAQVRVELVREGESLRVFLDERDVTDRLRSPEVTRVVSPVSGIPQVRDAMVREQRRLGTGGGVVLEGRDIGTVVFPDADLKVFLVASLEARARRRQQDLAAAGVRVEVPVLRAELEERDRRDSTRTAAPLRKAADAVELDTSDLTITEQVEQVVHLAEQVRDAKGR
jgi:cytidylate kinase